MLRKWDDIREELKTISMQVLESLDKEVEGLEAGKGLWVAQEEIIV
jgi:hypothetical protein